MEKKFSLNRFWCELMVGRLKSAICFGLVFSRAFIKLALGFFYVALLYGRRGTCETCFWSIPDDGLSGRRCVNLKAPDYDNEVSAGYSCQHWGA